MKIALQFNLMIVVHSSATTRPIFVSLSAQVVTCMGITKLT